jgi:hypothetical protein
VAWAFSFSMSEAVEGHMSNARRFWEQRYGRPLSDEEVEGIERNLIGFFKLLIELDGTSRKEVKR